ncbi:MAG TPA: glutaminyl-peptide cyclotransferase [Pyrinomonadaceae bacterium]|nr:glutaminyl-peptide cyclotransferase [Pyrinomonadaceae bacterium]
MRFLLLFASVAIATACGNTPGNSTTNLNTSTPKPAAAPLNVSSYEVVKVYPHDDKAFTQGLFFHDGFLYESTGQNGKSSLRKVEIETGKVLQKWDLPREDFGEGSTLIGDKIYMITWQQGLGRVFNLSDFKLLREFSYQGEGWGLTNDGTNLIMSQGTHVLKFIDPNTFQSNKTLAVMRENGQPLMQINELEWVKGEIWANIWHSEDPQKSLGKPNYIARIDPANGKLVGWIDLSNISPEDQRRDSENTLNGIAYDAATDRIFVTGKNWKKLYEIKLKPAQ